MSSAKCQYFKMATISIKDFLKSPKKGMIKCLVDKELSLDEFIIIDESSHCVIKIGEGFLGNKKLISKGNFLRIRNPSFQKDRRLLLDGQSSVFLTKFFQTKSLDAKIVEKIFPVGNHFALKDVKEKSPNDVIKSIHVKIVRSLQTRKRGRNNVCQVIVKDQNGDKNRLSIWNNLIKEIQVC